MFKWLFKSDRKAATRSSAGGSRGLTDSGNEKIGVLHSAAMHIALQHHQAGRLSEAEAVYLEVLSVDPDHTDALHLLGLIAYQAGDYSKADELISRALVLNPAYAAAWNNLGNVLRKLGRLDEALVCFRNAVKLEPDYVDGHVSLGALLKVLGRLDEASSCFEKLVSLAPGSPESHLRLGSLYESQGNLNEALACYQKALELNPDLFDVQFTLGNVLRTLGNLDTAAECYRKALTISPESAITCINLGNVLREQGETDEALVCYKKAIKLDPRIPEAHLNLGNALEDQNMAAACYRRALSINPAQAEAHYGLGNALRVLGRMDEAIACYRDALALKPDLAEVHFALGNALKDQDLQLEVIECYHKALEHHPEYAEAQWALAMSRIPAVYESEDQPAHSRAAFSRALDVLDNWFDASRVTVGFKAVGTQQPFCLAYQEQDNRELLQRYGTLCTRIMAHWFDQQTFPYPERRNHDAPMRVGVVSSYLCNHSVWNAIVKGWFQQIDRKRFSLHAFYLGSQMDQETLLAKACAEYFEYGRRDLRQWVEDILAQQPDVLIYPEIGMDPMTARLASLRLAPVQVVAWGHPETSGLHTIDYFLSAELLEPENAQKNYTEKLVALPNLGCFYQPFSVNAADPELGGMVSDPDTPLLLCPGTPFKYAPEHDWILVEISRRLGRCKLIFFTHKFDKISEKLRRRLRTAFSRERLDSERFVAFIPWQSISQFYGLMKRADVYLDTIGFSGFNTAIQAVECGLPVVTREGRFMRGRLASGILKRMGLAELVAETEEEYIALAVRLVQDVAYRTHIRERIKAERKILFEDTAPIRALEEFLTRVSVQR